MESAGVSLPWSLLTHSAIVDKCIALHVKQQINPLMLKGSYGSQFPLKNKAGNCEKVDNMK